MALREEPAYCRYCFDDVVINCRDFSVIKSAQKKTLTPRAFDVLRYLIEHSHRVVEKSELFEQIWKEKFVTDNALTRAVTEIRHALGDSADSPRYVETIHKRGYRFIAKMNGGSRMQVIQMHEEENTTISGFAEPSVEATVSKAAKASRSLSKNHLRLGFSRRELKVALLLVSVSVVIVATYLLTNRGTAIDSLAVMPFIAERGDAEMEYLADGLTASVVSNLSQLPGLKVMSRNSVLRYKGKEVDPRVVGRELGVRAVLLGRLEARGEDLAINLELVDTRDNRQLWGEQHKRKLSDLLQVQSDVSQVVSERLRLRLTGDEQKLFAKNYTENNEAYRLYLKGRYHLDKRTERDVERSNEYFQQAVKLDPEYALAYAGLADSYFVLGALGTRLPKEVMPKAKTAAARALQLDEYLSEAHASSGWLLMLYDYDLVGAERELKRAIELNPNAAIPHQYYAFCLVTLGRFEEAVSESKRALELDPLSLFINRSAGTVLYCARQYDQAIHQLQKTSELDPNFRHVYDWLVQVYGAKGLYDKAVEADLKQREVAGGYLKETIPALKKAYASAGWKGYWQKALEKEVAQQNLDNNPYVIALIYTRLGDKKLGLQWLESAYAEHICEMTTIKVNAEFDSLRSEPRFQELQRRIGFTQ